MNVSAIAIKHNIVKLWEENRMGFGLFGCGRWFDGCGCYGFGGWCGFGGFGFCGLDDILDDIIIDCNGWCGFGGWC